VGCRGERGGKEKEKDIMPRPHLAASLFKETQGPRFGMDDTGGRKGASGHCNISHTNVLGVWEIRDYAVERLIHCKLKHLKLRGEWFLRTAELLSFLANIDKRNEPIGRMVSVFGAYPGKRGGKLNAMVM
jgi:hypothetical protein